jgi:hypothetical protein
MCSRPMHSLVLRRSSNSTSTSNAQSDDEAALESSVEEDLTRPCWRCGDGLAAAAAAGSSTNLHRVTHRRAG